jgi:hypothetical protein
MEQLPKNKIYFFILNLYCLLAGLGWIFLHIYLRLIRETKTISLIELQSNFTYQKSIIITMVIFLHIVIVFTNIRYLIYQYILKKEHQPGILTKILLLCIDKVYWKPLNYIHEHLISNIPKSGDVYFAFAKKLDKYQPMQKTFIASAIFFDYSPRIIVTLCLFIDLFILKRLMYFPISLTLLIIPIVYAVILRILEDFAEVNLKIVGTIIRVTPNNIKAFHFQFDRQEEFNFLSHEEFREYVDGWKIFANLAIYIEAFKEFLYKYIPGVNLFCSLSYILCWSYYLSVMPNDVSIKLSDINYYIIYIAENFPIDSIEPFSGLLL